MKHLIPLLPFFFEIILDYWYIVRLKKQDIFDIGHRTLAVITCALLVVFMGNEAILVYKWKILLRGLILGTIPFMYFDNILAWLRGKRGLDYAGKTKPFDLWLARFNPYTLLIIRTVIAGLLFWAFVKMM